MALIEVSVDKRVGEITLNRPEKLNAMHPGMLEELDAAFEQLKNDRNVFCVLVKGEGKAFSVGYDLVSRSEGVLKPSLMADWQNLNRHTEQWLRVWDFPKPIVSAVHGYCLAGAAFMVCMTDIVVAADDLVVAWARVPLGGGWLTQIFCHLVGPRKAYELSTIRGSQMSGLEAAQLGWANYAVPEAEVVAKARELAQQVARIPIDLLLLNKRAKNRAMERMGFRDAIVGGIETNNLAHFTPGAQIVRGKLKELGIQGVIEWFDSGGTLKEDFDQ
jgi:enoyl-CoA hydratase